ncbi:head GIN domain-containing protein [Maricaulis sp.]|uniref:head GIN domain-containing protein n=1 Tax=Maricaulis sp. TaxID=1486257 RepID=UPI002607A8E8|nr:head GIN domain-containing protein [Maricaulis sp.]
MRKLASLAAVAALSAGLSVPALAQDSQDVNVEVFDRIDAAGSFRVILLQGDSHSVRLDGDGDDFAEIEVSVRRGELELDQDTRWFGNNPRLDVTVYVTAPDFTHMDFGRGVGAEVRDFDTAELDLEISTGAVARLTGTCDELDLSMSTGGVLYADSFVCARVYARASTGATGDVHATAHADVRASMGASYDVYGNPDYRELRSTMGASVRLVRPRS